MGQREEPLFDSQDDRGRLVTECLIEKRLHQHRAEVAEVLSIDVSDRKTRVIPALYPRDDVRSARESYVNWRPGKVAQYFHNCGASGASRRGQRPTASAVHGSSRDRSLG